jgi:uncharacterized C2H2 Zn-finger protein
MESEQPVMFVELIGRSPDSWEKRFICTRFTNTMGLFSRKKEIIIGDICPKCSMKFSNAERTLRHIEKAHKSKKKFECDSCGFRN